MSSFLEGPKAALLTAKDYNNGHYTAQPSQGVRAFGRVYSAWAYGQAVSFRPYSQDYQFSVLTPLPVVSHEILSLRWKVYGPGRLHSIRMGSRNHTRLGRERLTHAATDLAAGRCLACESSGIIVAGRLGWSLIQYHSQRVDHALQN